MIPSRTLNLNRRTSNFNLDPEVKGELSVLPTAIRIEIIGDQL